VLTKSQNLSALVLCGQAGRCPIFKADMYFEPSS